jgi:hypothetical protein
MRYPARRTAKLARKNYGDLWLRSKLVETKRDTHLERLRVGSGHAHPA